MSCSVIIVTHNSERYLPKAMNALLQQTRPADQILLVDSGSKDTSYLEPYKQVSKVILAPKDIGFCRGNNIGYRHIPSQTDYVFLVNPDLFLSADYLQKAATHLEQNPQCGALTG